MLSSRDSLNLWQVLSSRRVPFYRVLLSCGLQESACGPHRLPMDSLFLTNLRTPIIFFFQAVLQLLSCCCQTAGLLLHKLGSLQQQTNMRTPTFIFLKLIRDCLTLYPSLSMLIAALLLKLDMQAYK